MYRGQYKTANDALQLGVSQPRSNNYAHLRKPRQPYTTQQNINPVRENYTAKPTASATSAPTSSSNTIDLSDPKVWGPSFWFGLHNGANHYPEKATNITAEKMKNFIDGIPYMLPCSICSDHANAFIDKMKSENRMDDIVSGRENLFKFFWEFHNMVNSRTQKPELPLEDAVKLYSYTV